MDKNMISIIYISFASDKCSGVGGCHKSTLVDQSIKDSHNTFLSRDGSIKG